MSSPRPLRVLGLALLAPAALSAFTIEIDYSLDTGTFFSGNAAAQAALAAAAADISAVVTSSLNPIPSDTITGTHGSTTVTVDWALNVSNPSTGTASTVETFSLAANTFRIYAGARTLEGATLGVGGHVGASIEVGATGFVAELPSAMDAAEANSDAAMTRGPAGPNFGAITGDLGGEPFNFNLGPVAGSLSFDDDSVWHYDHTTPVAPGTADFYSVALHEILHTLGIGVSATWNNLTDGTTWLGAEAIALHGTGENLISAGGDHIAENITSPSIGLGAVQEVVMDPNITLGTRKFLTELDLAFLRDLGYETISTSAIPEPASFAALLGLGMMARVVQRRRRPCC